MSEQLKPFYVKNCIEVGIDEAGRGPLFGRVYVGAVILPADESFDHSLMKDSKKFGKSKKQQEKLMEAYEYIKKNAIAYSSYWLCEKTIDELNIYQATHKAMHEAIKKLHIVPEHILVDGNKFYPYKNGNRIIPSTCIKGGDNKFSSIAAASIIAKVERDKYIEEICNENPDLIKKYDLLNNKGYGTKNHMKGIEKYGISKWHRQSFGPCKKLNLYY
jgi:ribonuclease HII